MNTRSVALVGVAVLAVAALAVGTTWRLASATGPDVNNDGIVLSQDISAVVMAYGQEVPSDTPTNTPTDTPTNTPTSTPIPTFTPQPQTGGGREQVLVQNLVLRAGGCGSSSGWCKTRVATVDSNSCPGALVYFVARSAHPVLATIIKVYINDEFIEQIQVDPLWRRFYYQRAASTIDIEVNTGLGIDAEVSVDMHCEPTHE